MPTIFAPIFKASSFAAQQDISVDMTGVEQLLVQVWNKGTLTAGGTPINSVVIDPLGLAIALTGEAELSGATVLGVGGKVRAFKWQGSGLTGVLTVRVTLADANGKPYTWVQRTSGYGAISAIVQAAGGSAAASAAVPSAVGRLALSFLMASGYADASTITGTGTTSVLSRVLSTDGGGANDLTGAILSTPGAASTAVSASGSSTFGNWAIAAWSLTPTITALAFAGTVGAQSGTVGAVFAWTGAALSTFFSGGTAPYVYTIASGTLPAGLTLNASTGVVSGTPTAAGAGAVVLRVTDSAGSPAIVNSNSVTFTVAAAPATATTLSGPSGGRVGVASGAFTAGANGAITGTITITPSDSGDGGTFSPTSATISAGSPTAAFTYTPSSTGAKSISIANSGGLANAAAIPYTVTTTPGRLLFNNAATDKFRTSTSGALLASLAVTLWFHHPTTGALVGTLSAATDAAGLLGIISSGSLALSTPYRIDYKFSTGEVGVVYRTTEAT